ncbi:MAG: Zn-ribbon domain-containing OB-fold protein [Pararhodobacter sp.]
MSAYTKPLPTLDDVNRPFWDACREGRLALQKCRSCAHLRYPVSHVCPECLSYESDWTTVSGKGEVFSYIVFHQVYNEAFAQDVPYNVAIIQLDEGPRMISNVTGVANDAVKVGDRVEVVFDPVTDEITIPRFKPAG